MFDIQDLVKNKIYLIIPIVCLLLWALLSLIKDNFNLLTSVDYNVFYKAGKTIYSNPALLYESNSYYFYFPSFAELFVFLTIFDYGFSQWIFFIVILICSIMTLMEFNKILQLYGLKSKFIRFLFLMVLSNGLKIMNTFDYLQPKFIAAFLLLLFIRREIEIRVNIKENNLKFTIIQYIILIFEVGMTPSLIFLIPIYLFYNIKLKDIFKKVQVEKYFLFLIIFLITNFMFLVYPPLIFNYINSISIKGTSKFDIYSLTPDIIVANQQLFPFSTIKTLYLILNLEINISLLSGVIMLIMTFIIMAIKKITLEKKFGLLILSSLFFNVNFLHNIVILVVPILLILLIHVIDLIQDIKSLSNFYLFIKSNFVFLVGLLSLSFLNFFPPIYFLYREFPITRLIPLPILMLIETFDFILFFVIVYLLRKKLFIKFF
ncbi:MAG: hypothetical protein ACTSRH_16940 [Promethearchaeota archaeon]